ncbi:hypothetical protein SMACR_07942 [Sordaria macrospora]|uniref:WGS project CABT00000000 data, contig 2.48 n=2 Tax=Sordaria macrospora TaxID=5147 RepID=F7W8Z2_SORMK|nr:uncharacterized protein SMAC_07942 [Sordaria macrospora k-hell]KAA8631977.1 hypothetical protein SMACR_07942 [Sordaria macrospora]KAH7632380.1 hypothetical protein B0T09DRAFT_354541 [Sordaria sp. MPI-SDFR-AT-0083]WPJ61119.1 hypothetical protein SMAC4_07942 [Sordaria macrospora]CCC13873.1 unnamed protein product [Sordaria macrospora k-hell]
MADPFAVIEAAQTCIQVGKKVYKFCQNYHNASDNLYGVTVRLRSVIMQIETLGNALLDARNSPAKMEEVRGQAEMLFPGLEDYNQQIRGPGRPARPL